MISTNELDRAIKIAQQIRVKLFSVGEESLEELAYTMEILMCKTHDQISLLNSENTGSVSNDTDESCVLHGVRESLANDRTDEASQSSVDGTLEKITEAKEICEHCGFEGRASICSEPFCKWNMNETQII